jgi:hypothetical protein
MTGPTACLLLVGTLLVSADGQAKDNRLPEAERPEIAGVRVGFAGRYKVGLWTPVEVRLRGGGQPVSGEVSLIVPDGDGVPSRVATPPEGPCRVLPGQDSRVLLYARFGRIENQLSVEFRLADGRLVTRKDFTAADRPSAAGSQGSLRWEDRTDLPPAIAAARTMIVAVGADSLGLEGAVGSQRQAPDEQTVVVRLEDVSQLPGEWAGYEGVDTLVLSTSRPELYKGLPAGCPQIEALELWVQMGGKLVLCVGSQAEAFRGRDPLLAPLAPLLPGRLETERNNATEEVKMFPLRQAGALETYCASTVPIPAQDVHDVLQVPKLVDLDVDAVIEAREVDLPLVVRAPRGFGQIVFFAGDLDRQPLSQWKDRPRLVSALLGLPAADNEESAERGAIMRYGFEDLAGQLRSALDQFTKVRSVPFQAVVVLLALYLLLIGPGDYFFLRKVVRRIRWAWVTFPTVVLLFSVGAYVAAHRLKGDRVRINQVDLVDVNVGEDARSGMVRGTSWMNVFSPQSKAFNLSLRPRLPDGTAPRDAKVFLAWLGLPGRALGGMDSQASSPVLWTKAYDFSPELDAMRNVPIPIWSTKSLTARWTAPAKGCLRAELVDEDGAVVGTITNTLRFPLAKCLLIYGHHAYTLKTRDNDDPRDAGRLGTLQPGESTTIDPWTRRSELKTLLTGQRLIKNRPVSTLYDQSSVDLHYILQAMMFFEEAGGRRYTGLDNGYQDFVDLTHLLKTNRAILLAHGPAAAGEPGHGADLLCKDGNGEPITAEQDQHVTIYRFVFPVKTAASS